VHVSEQYGYANQVLDERSIKLFQGDKRILEQRHKFRFDNLKRPNTKIFTTKLAAYPERDLMQVGYSELLDYGFKIAMKYKPYIGVDQRINVEYYLIKVSSQATDYGGIPPDHKITFDRNDAAIRIEGPNVPGFIGQWHSIRSYYLTEKIQSAPRALSGVVAESDAIMSQLSGTLQRTQELALDIPEIPVMITSTGDLICIPKENDPPTIACVGRRGEGKSFLLHRLLDMFHWRWGTSNIIMNDITGETARWSKPWQKGTTFAAKAMNDLSMYDEHTLPLPIVYLHPERSPKIPEKEMYHPYKSGVKISLPFKEVIKDFDTTLRGHKNWELGKSGRWFRNIVRKFPDEMIIGDFEVFIQQVKDALNQMRTENEDVPDGVQAKIISILRDFYNANFLDVSNGLASTWKVDSDLEKWESYPWLVLMKYKLIPSLLTLYIRNKEWFPQYFRFINDTIMDNQTQSPLFKETVIMEFIDELTGITSRDVVNAASETIERTFAEGRNMRIGAVYATQNYEKVPAKVSTNTHYAFVFRQAKEGIEALRKDFPEIQSSGRGGWKSEIMRLKRFECVALTTKEFVRYKETGEAERSTGPFKGTILPPLSGHKSPNEKL